MNTTNLPKSTAIKFVVIIGIVSLFADMTYEGARSIFGPYLSLLGASGFTVGFIAGFGELVGYGFRFISGYFSDKTGKYWPTAIAGYLINLLAVPLMAFARTWPIACSLIIAERFGKAIRLPARDAMLSYATKETGRGWGFGLHEAMDKIGAIFGPMFVMMLLYFNQSYQTAFALLFFPAFAALIALVVAKRLYPKPENLEIETLDMTKKGVSTQFWLYTIGTSFVAAGYVDFALISYHFQKSHVIDSYWIPGSYAMAMAAAGITAVILGPLYDRVGIRILVITTVSVSVFPWLVFSDNAFLVSIGVVLWGIGLGAQESIMRAVIGDLIAVNKRATAYGIQSLFFGCFWFLGSTLMGYLYDISLVPLIVFSIIAQLASIPFFLKTSNEA